jgi:hypothetical protein
MNAYQERYAEVEQQFVEATTELHRVIQIEAVELRITYAVATISAKAKSFDRKFQVNRTVHFETIVLRELLRNPTKLNAKLLAQTHNHFKMWHNSSIRSDQFLALPKSIQITNVRMLGHKEFPV